MHVAVIVPLIFRRGIVMIFVAAVAVLCVMVFSAIAPYNMDEFIHYVTLLCYLYPANNLHGTCDAFALDFLHTGLVLPLRASPYSGSFPSLYYLPIHLLWSSPVAARLLGLGFLSLGGFVAAKAFRFPPRYVVLGLLFLFPYVFQHLVDTGPIGFHILSIFLLYMLSEQWVATAKWRFVLSSTVLVFLGIWTKFSYFWLLPGIVAVFGMHAIRFHERWREPSYQRRMLLQMVAASMLLAVLVGSLLLSTHPTDPAARPYLQALLASDAWTVMEMLRGDWLHSRVIPMFLNPLAATERVFEPASIPLLSAAYFIIVYLFTPVTLTLLVLNRRMRNMRLLPPFVLFLVFLLTVLMIIRTKDSRHMHHAILSYPFLLLAILATIERLRDAMPGHRLWKLFGAVWMCAFILLNATLFVLFPSQQIRGHDDPSKLLAHTIVSDERIAGRYVVLVVDWGMYFYSGLFGSTEKSVLFEWRLQDPRRIEELRNLARMNGRKLLVLYEGDASQAGLPAITSALVFPEHCQALPKESRWRIVADFDPALRQICSSYEVYDADAIGSVRQVLRRAPLTLQ